MTAFRGSSCCAEVPRERLVDFFECLGMQLFERLAPAPDATLGVASLRAASRTATSWTRPCRKRYSATAVGAARPRGRGAGVPRAQRGSLGVDHSRSSSGRPNVRPITDATLATSRVAGVETVEPRLQAPHARAAGDRQLVDGDGELPVARSTGWSTPPLDEVAQGLFEEEGVAARARGQELRYLDRQVGPRGGAGEQLALFELRAARNSTSTKRCGKRWRAELRRGAMHWFSRSLR